MKLQSQVVFLCIFLLIDSLPEMFGQLGIANYFFCSDLIFTYGNQADGHPGHPPHGCIALNLRTSERFYVSASTFFLGIPMDT